MNIGTIAAILGFALWMSPVLFGKHLLEKGKTLRTRRLGWRMLYFVDVMGHAGLTDGGARVYNELDRRFTAQYGERP